MKRKVIIALLWALLAILLIAVPVLAYTYYGAVTVTENGTAAHTMSPLTVAANNTWMANNGFMTASGLDTRIETLGGLAKPHMLTETSAWFATAVPLNGQVNLYYTMGNSLLAAFNVIFGEGGYAKTHDAAALEPGSSFLTTLNNVYVDTAAGYNRTLVEKLGAYVIADDYTTAQKINASVGYTPGKAQAITGGSRDALNGAATEYFGLMGGGYWNGTEANVLQVMPTAGALADFYVDFSANVPAGTTETLTILKNGAATALTVTVIAGASTGNIQGTDVSFVAGDTVSVRSTYTGAPGAFGYASWSVIWKPTTYNQTIMLGNTITSNAGTLYSMLEGENNLASATEAENNAPMPTAGTFSNLYVKLSASPGAAPDDYKFTLREGAGATTLTCTITAPATTGNDTTHTNASVAGDLVDLEMTPENAPAASPYAGYGMVFTPTSTGEAVTFGGGVNATPDPAATNYQTVHGNNENAWQAVEANTSHHLYFVRQSKLYVKLSVAPDNGAGTQSFTFTLRQDAASTGITCAISEAGTTGNDTTHNFVITTGGLGAMQSVPANTPLATRVHWGFVTNTCVHNVFQTSVAAGQKTTVKAGLRPCLDYVDTNSDYTGFGDNAAFSFTDGAGTDQPFTIIMRVNLDDATSGAFFAKETAGNREYACVTTGADAINFSLVNADASAFIERDTGAITSYENSYTHLVFTYDGSEAAGGLHIYANGINIDAGAPSAGGYAGMTNGTAPLEIGRAVMYGQFLDGKCGYFKLYSRELSAAEVLADFNGTHSTVGLVSNVPMYEGVGLPQDSSGNGHHATVNAADWTSNGFGLGINGVWTYPLTAPVPNNANPITWGSNAVPYIGSMTHEVGGVQVLRYAPVAMIRGLNYSTGNVTVTNGSATVTGGGTAFTSSMAGGIFVSTDGVYYTVSSVTNATTLVLSTVYAGATLAAQPYNLYPLLNDETGTYDAAITFGANPAGTTVTLGSVTASSQPQPGSTTEEPPADILPSASVSDWFKEPDVTVTLLSNPIRPFVKAVADITTLSESQAWVWLGTAFVLLVLAVTAKNARGHYAIVGIATGVAIGICVQQTIYPLWALVVAILAIIVGLVAERSPSL